MTAGPNNDRGSLSKGLRILSAFDEKHSALSVAEIARRTQISRASVYRLTGVLEDLGYIGRTGRLFRPSRKVLHLGVAAVESREFVDHIYPHLDQMSRELPDATAVNYGVLETPRSSIWRDGIGTTSSASTSGSEAGCRLT